MNRRLRRHTKIVYSSLSIRHVAEQIHALYWNSAAADDRDDKDEESHAEEDCIAHMGGDLTRDQYVRRAVIVVSA